MKKWRLKGLVRWLTARAREELLTENARLEAALAAARAENDELRAYLAGMRTALRLGRQIKIYNTAAERQRLLPERGEKES